MSESAQKRNWSGKMSISNLYLVCLTVNKIKSYYRICVQTQKLEFEYIFLQLASSSDVGIVVSIAAFQAVDPGSIKTH